MCVVVIAPHLLGLLQLHTVTFKLNDASSRTGSTDQVISSLLRTIAVLLEVIVRVDAPFAESLIKSISRLLSDRPTNPAPDSLVHESSSQSLPLFTQYTEEMRADIALILGLCYEKLSPVSLAALSTPTYIPPLFFIIYQILDIAVHDRNRNNQRLALESINKIVLALSPPPIAQLVKECSAQSSDIASSETKTDDSNHSLASEDQNQSKRNPSSQNQQKNDSPQNLVASIVPGILTSVTRILLGDYKQGQEVFVAGFRLLSSAISSTMADVHNAHLALGEVSHSTSSESAFEKLKSMMMSSKQKGEEGEEKDNSGYDAPNDMKRRHQPSTSKSNPKNSSNEQVGHVERDSDWFKKASYHVCLVIGRIYSMSRIMAEEMSRNASMSVIVLKSPEVRLAMVKSAATLLTLCRRTLVAAFSTLFEILVLFAFDEYQPVTNLCVTHLTTLQKTEIARLPSTFSSHVSQLVKSMPRIMRDADDHKKLLLLRLLTGWIRISEQIAFPLLPSLADSLTGFAHLLPLQSSLTFLNPQVSLLPSSEMSGEAQNANFASMALQHLRQTYQSQFAYFKDPRVHNALITLIRHLGAQGNVEYWFDLLFSHFSSEPHVSVDNLEEDEYESTPQTILANCASAIFVLNEIMMGASGFVEFGSDRRIKLSREARNRLKGQWEHYLMFLMGDSVWKRDEGSKNDFANRYRRFRLILVVEGLGNMAMVFGKQFTAYFLNTLYRVLSMAGSDEEILSRVGKMTLVRFAQHTGFSTVVSMVEANMDYVVEEMARELRYGEDVETALKVFGGILHIRSALIIPLLDDLIDDIFKRLDFRQEHLNRQLIGILEMVIRVVSNHVPAGQKSRLQIRIENEKRKKEIESSDHADKDEDKDTTSEGSLLPEYTRKQEGDVLEDHTMHAWIQRCELEYVGRIDLQSSHLPSAQETSTDNDNRTEDHFEDEDVDDSESRMARGEAAEKSSGAHSRSRALRRERFQKELERSYIQEDESTLAAKGGFGLSKWLRTRVKRRKDEAEALESIMNPSKSASKNSSAKDAESFFRDHHKKKDEKAMRGDDLHDGAEEASRAAEEEDIDSDEEYAYPVITSTMSTATASQPGASKKETEISSKNSNFTGKLKKLPHRPGFDVVHSIVLRLVNWLSVREVDMRCAVLGAVSDGLVVLAEHKKVLLPTIHSLWSALQWRFLDEDARVVEAAWSLVRAVGVYGRSFLARKFAEDLWPLLRDLIRSHNPFIPEGIRYIARANVLTQYSTVGRGSEESDFFSASASFRIQHALIATLTFATQHLSLPASITQEMGREAWFYLSAAQPTKLQQSALMFYHSILGPNATSSASDNPTQQVKGSETNGLFLLLAQLLAQPWDAPNDAQTYLKSFKSNNDKEEKELPTLSPTVYGVLPQKFAKNPSSFFSLFHKNVSSLLLHTSQTHTSSLPL